MRKLRGALFLLLLAGAAAAQIHTPVTWQMSQGENELVFTAHIEDGWHIYDLNAPPYGPNPTEFNFEKVTGAELAGKVTSPSPLIKAYEEMFDMQTAYYEGASVFVQKFKLQDAAAFGASGYISYSACSVKRCVNLTEEFSFPAEEPAAGAAMAEENENALWRPVTAELGALSGRGAAQTSRSGIFLICFIGGLAALLMPCIWPIIPLTVSFFLKRSGGLRKKAVGDAALYGLAILIIYVALGLLFTLLFGASALNSLATNAWVNLFFFALITLFAISFFGAFEIRLPAAWANKINAKARSSAGVTGIFFMAFTLALVSFSCTGPIIGTLLVQLATTDSVLAPAVGMTGFGLALAAPFALFALSPALMQKMPKSGEWMNVFKVTLGFLELALALKFLSVADLAYHWNILDREIFLVLWILIFLALGFYLLRMKKFSLTRLILALASFAFTAYMAPGLWGAPLKEISAFLPPLYTQSFNLYGAAPAPAFYDYEEGMAFAARSGKPAMIDFTGYGCVNCRKMEAAVLADARVKEIIENKYVLISLYVDDKTKLPGIIEKEENGKKIKLRSVGDKWSYFQRYKFGANAQPFYVLLGNGGSPLAPWYAYDENIDDFINFLNAGLEKYKHDTVGNPK
jgi:thiol:disulfide interchange protein DsbD